mmetsp:Transcript_17645/g.24896  ORF Transcript_17645/g.24896 Transcript_17645/m.24896 type:complete len:205 (-) Transcript_17645:586-1200(-)
MPSNSASMDSNSSISDVTVLRSIMVSRNVFSSSVLNPSSNLSASSDDRPDSGVLRDRLSLSLTTSFNFSRIFCALLSSLFALSNNSSLFSTSSNRSMSLPTRCPALTTLFITFPISPGPPASPLLPPFESSFNAVKPAIVVAALLLKKGMATRSIASLTFGPVTRMPSPIKSSTSFVNSAARSDRSYRLRSFVSDKIFQALDTS